MTSDLFERTALRIGSDGLARLRGAFVCVAGLGAVGSYAVEALARAGVGRLRVVDSDRVRRSNRNRQLYALESTAGRPKAEVARERILDIHPACQVEALPLFVGAGTLEAVLAGPPDAVIDAIDSCGPKGELIAGAVARGVPVLSSMGAATRTDPSQIRAGDLFKARNCPLARLLRKRLRRRGIVRGVRCVYSLEAPSRCAEREIPDAAWRGRPRDVLGSLPTIPGMFGLWLAHEAIALLLGGFPSGTPPSTPHPAP
jgi:tRNA A37 threonylcarbamoyladenosine dehydratase